MISRKLTVPPAPVVYLRFYEDARSELRHELIR